MDSPYTGIATFFPLPCMPLETLEQINTRAAISNIDLNDRVNRDEVVPPLHGGSAIVYQGTLSPQGQRVVVKSLRLSPSSDAAAIDHIVKSVLLWSELQHTNIIRVFGLVTKFDFAVSIILAYVPKGNAFDYVQNKDIDPRPILLDVARGLHYLHTYDRNPIFHGDLRGRNILISADGRGLLTDYGLSSLIDTSFSMTAAAPIHPTVRWMAPEQIHNFGEVTIQGDVWAFGITALELFTRRPPYDDIHDTRGVIHRILKGPPNRPSDESTSFRMTDPWWEMCSLCWEPESARPPISDIVKKITSVKPESTLERQRFITPAYSLLFFVVFVALFYSVTRFMPLVRR